MRKNVSTLLLFLSITVFVSSGCSKDQIMGWFGQSKPDAAPATPVQKPKIFTSPFMELSVSPAVRADACFVKLHTFNDDRPNVLMVTSYQGEDSETFPSLMIQAQVTDSSLEALAGRALDAQIYAAKGENQVWSNVEGESIQIKLTVSESDVSGEISGGSVFLNNPGEPTNATGKFYSKK